MPLFLVQDQNSRSSLQRRVFFECPTLIWVTKLPKCPGNPPDLGAAIVFHRSFHQHPSDAVWPRYHYPLVAWRVPKTRHFIEELEEGPGILKGVFSWGFSDELTAFGVLKIVGAFVFFGYS